MFWHVYIAEAKAGRYYVGITTNVVNRIEVHNAGLGAKFALDQGNFRLKYFSSAFPNKSEARKREIQIKGWSRAKKEKLIAGEWQ